MRDPAYLKLSPEAMKALKQSMSSLFNPSPEVAAWMEANRPDEAEIMATLQEHYLREARTDGAVH